MKKVVIEPLKKVGDISFGMKRDEVRKVMGAADVFWKSPYDASQTDDYGFVLCTMTVMTDVKQWRYLMQRYI